MFGYTAFPSIYGPSLTGIARTARANDCLRPGEVMLCSRDIPLVPSGFP
jgi:hypothetical protein